MPRMERWREGRWMRPEATLRWEFDQVTDRPHSREIIPASQPFPSRGRRHVLQMGAALREM